MSVWVFVSVGASGSVWHGEVADLKLNRWNRSLGSVSWQFEPAKLLSGHMEFLVRFGQGSDDQIEGRGRMGLSFSGDARRKEDERSNLTNECMKE